MISRYHIDKEIDALINSIEQKTKNDLVDSAYFLNKLDEKYKEAMNKLCFHARMSEGRLVVVVSPDDDTDRFQELDLTDELKEYVYYEKLDLNRSDDLRDFVESLYNKETNND